jgi:hypothetical protein
MAAIGSRDLQMLQQLAVAGDGVAVRVWWSGLGRGLGWVGCPSRELLPVRVVGGCGWWSGPPGPGPCLGGWPPPSASVPLAGCLAACWRPGWGWSSAAWRRWRPAGAAVSAQPGRLAWRRGAAGERRTARLLAPLERQGWVVLHDLAVPGSRAILDHLVIGPGGVFVIDSKQYRGRLHLDPTRRLWHGRYSLAPALHAVSFEADQAAQVMTDQAWRQCRLWPFMAPRSLGQGGHGRGAGRASTAPARHAARTPGGARTRARRRPGPGPLPRRLTACRSALKARLLRAASPGRLPERLTASIRGAPAHCSSQTIAGRA